MDSEAQLEVALWLGMYLTPGSGTVAGGGGEEERWKALRSWALANFERGPWTQTLVTGKLPGPAPPTPSWQPQPVPEDMSSGLKHL